MQNIALLPVRFDVLAAREELKACSGWNLLPLRTQHPKSPHRECDDIWVRYQNRPSRSDGSFDCVWYDVADELPAVMDLCEAVCMLMEATELGGVLVTRIPAGKQVYPHSDHGWHAEHYEKFAVQIVGNAKQSFCFEDGSLSPESGDLFTFCNQAKHYVLNNSDEDRITLICCILRGGRSNATH
jgi:Aspartyl/Asparaginyl beta-hydroxylase